MSKLFFFALGLHYLCPRKVIITMNKKFLISFLLGALCTFSAFAQQVTELQRTKSIFVYPDFCPGRVIQAFGRSVTDSVNIYYGDASLCFHRGDTIFKANLDGIYGLVIGDDEYKKVGTQMGRVVAKKGYNALICVTEVDHRKLEAETTGGEKLPYFQIENKGGRDNTRQPKQVQKIRAPRHEASLQPPYERQILELERPTKPLHTTHLFARITFLE